MKLQKVKEVSRWSMVVNGRRADNCIDISNISFYYN